MATSHGSARILTNYEVLVAPVGSTLPTDHTTAPDAAFTTNTADGTGGYFGYVSEDGAARSREGDSTEIRDWAGGLVKTITSNQSRQWTITALQKNPVVEALEEPGQEVSDTAGVKARTIKDASPARRAVIIQQEDGDDTVRVVIPEAEITVDSVTSANAEGLETVTFLFKTVKQSGGEHYFEYSEGESV